MPEINELSERDFSFVAYVRVLADSTMYAYIYCLDKKGSAIMLYPQTKPRVAKQNRERERGRGSRRQMRKLNYPSLSLSFPFAHLYLARI